MTRKKYLFGRGSYVWLGLCTLIGAATFGLLKATGEGWTHPSLASYQQQLCDYVQCKNGYEDPRPQHWQTQSIEWVKSEQQLTIRTRIQPIESSYSATALPERSRYRRVTLDAPGYRNRPGRNRVATGCSRKLIRLQVSN